MGCLRLGRFSGSSSPWSAHGPRRWRLIASPIEASTYEIRAPLREHCPLVYFPSAFVWAFTIAAAALFVVAAAMLNRLTLILAPVALACVLLYSFTKRWTQFSHLVLGACLSIAPTGAWIAVRGEIGSPVPLLLSLVVLLWTAGFDVLYACQDYDFDRREGLRSIPARVGIARALWIARALHAAAFLALVWLFLITQLGPIAFVGVLATAALLVYQHRLVRAGDLSRLNAAFFTTNAFVSVILLATFGSAVFLNQ